MKPDDETQNNSQGTRGSKKYRALHATELGEDAKVHILKKFRKSF
jgi:hypothetical protein